MFLVEYMKKIIESETCSFIGDLEMLVNTKISHIVAFSLEAFVNFKYSANNTHYRS